MCEKKIAGDFDILEFEDKKFDQSLSTGVLSDVPTYSNSEITDTQVLGISTKELIPRESNPQPPMVGDIYFVSYLVIYFVKM